nr:twin-arginine translocation signal domain-containing protein [Pseudomonas moorei]
MGRRDFLQACALLSLGGLVFGVSEVVARPTPVKSEFVVINGWVLPAQHFRQTQA